MVLHLNKLESPLPKDALCPFGWNWPSGSGEEDFLILSMILLFRNYLPLKKGGALHLNKLESSLPKDTLCQVWLILATWFLRGRFFLISSIYFRNYLPYLGIEQGPSFEQTWIPFTQECFVPSLFEIGPVVLEKKIF